MPSQGYVRYPTIHRNLIVFVAEDDLWEVSSEGGRAERLSAGAGEVSHPRFSPDGQLLAFVGREEGPSEVYVMPAAGGQAQRLTFQSANCRVLGWSPAGDAILYSSGYGQANRGAEVIYAISPTGGQPRQLPLGVANAVSYGPRGGTVLGRNTGEPARWKRYRGGTVGHLWCDPNDSGNFQRLLAINGNIANPCWIGDRIYFISDHEGVGNVYSCTPQGEDVRRHSNQQDFYARNLSTDGERLVFHAGADLYLLDPETDAVSQVSVELPSQRTQRNRKFASASHYLDSYALHPQGYAVAVTTRGKAFSMANWEGAVIQHGEPDGVRYRFLEWLNDGTRLVAIHDAPGREALIVFDPESADEPKVYADIEFGRATNLVVSPRKDQVAITNHRNELIVVDLESGTSSIVDNSEHGRVSGVTWSPDGNWLAYSFANTSQKRAIKLCQVETGETHFATDPVLQDVGPSFDPQGKYLYFLGYRVFNPVYDNLHFDLGFPRGMKPYAITLRKDLRSPFIPEPKAPSEKEKEKEKEKNKGKLPKKEEPEDTEPNEEEPANESEGQTSAESEETPAANEPEAMVIDLEGITARVLPFPVQEGRYYGVRGIKGKALFLVFPIEGALHQPIGHQSHEPKGHIDYYDFESQKYDYLIGGVSSFDLSRDSKTLIYSSNRRLRAVKVGEKTKGDHDDHASRENGWLELHRVKVSVQPAAEWKQMFAEAWRLQREQFWAEDMSGIDWQAIYEQYSPLVERVTSRAELSDLFWEMQGELGTSHAYEGGGDTRHGPHYSQGFLGVDWSYDAEKNRYRIAHIVRGDPSESQETSPLTLPGLNVAEGDAVIAINGQRLSAKRGPQEMLVSQARNEIQLTIEAATTGEVHTVSVKALSDEKPARYREWVENNRRFVHEQSDGRVGYIHIPDMGSHGYAEFHRGFLAEYDYQSLLIDVRYNGGGNVSPLLLEKLARRRIGYDFPRWSKPAPYPAESPRGPMVALTNEQAGSDGDIFSHSFKLMGLGPLIGKRTWGGVIGISPSHALVDGTRTTQPEYAFWFKDVGWNVENYGTDPDIEVDIAPQDYVNNKDPQLERSIVEALRLLEERPGLEPNAEERPKKGRMQRIP